MKLIHEVTHHPNKIKEHVLRDPLTMQVLDRFHSIAGHAWNQDHCFDPADCMSVEDRRFRRQQYVDAIKTGDL